MTRRLSRLLGAFILRRRLHTLAPPDRPVAAAPENESGSADSTGDGRQSGRQRADANKLARGVGRACSEGFGSYARRRWPRLLSSARHPTSLAHRWTRRGSHDHGDLRESEHLPADTESEQPAPAPARAGTEHDRVGTRDGASSTMFAPSRPTRLTRTLPVAVIPAARRSDSALSRTRAASSALSTVKPRPLVDLTFPEVQDMNSGARFAGECCRVPQNVGAAPARLRRGSCGRASCSRRPNQPKLAYPWLPY